MFWVESCKTNITDHTYPNIPILDPTERTDLVSDIWSATISDSSSEASSLIASIRKTRSFRWRSFNFKYFLKAALSNALCEDGWFLLDGLEWWLPDDLWCCGFIKTDRVAGTSPRSCSCRAVVSSKAVLGLIPGHAVPRSQSCDKIFEGALASLLPNHHRLSLLQESGLKSD